MNKLEKGFNWGYISRFRSEIMGVAALWVVLHHNYFDLPRLLSHLKKIGVYGNAGVDVFLFLSGIGLYFAYLKKPPLRRFYARRFVKLLISYFLIAVPYYIWLWTLSGDGGSLILNITGLSLPFKGIVSTWYVPLAAVLYLLYPLIHRLLERERYFGATVDRYSTAVVICTGIVFGCFCLRKIIPDIYDNCEIALTRALIFVVGCAVGRLVYEKRVVSQAVVFASASVVVLFVLIRETTKLPEIWMRFTFTPLAVALCVLLSCAFKWLSGIKFIGAFFRFFGERSLELCLSHVLIRNVFYHYYPVKLWDSYGVLTYAVIIVISIIFSWLLHPVIDKFCKLLLKS